MTGQRPALQQRVAPVHAPKVPPEPPVSPEKSVDLLAVDAKAVALKMRPVHTVGIGAGGIFIPSDVAKDFCTAEFFTADRTAVTVRFSNGLGDAEPHDSWNDVRGMAVRFHLANGSAADLLAMTLPEFFTRTVETFGPFADRTTPVDVTRSSAWEKLRDMLCLILPLEDPPANRLKSGEGPAVLFADYHPECRLAMFHAAALGAPVSYARAAYHAVHTFVVTGAGKARRHVRFHWVPVAGVRNRTPGDPVQDRYLQDELRKRVAKEPVRFQLMMTIGEAGDDFDDASRSWPPHRVRVVMGTLVIDTVHDDQGAFGEKLTFNPWRLVDGIEPGNDPILRLRRYAYEVSRGRREVSPCPFARDD